MGAAVKVDPVEVDPVEVDPVRAAVWVRLPKSGFRTPSEVLKPFLKKRELLLIANCYLKRKIFLKKD
jgi:hypothetical protein